MTDDVRQIAWDTPPGDWPETGALVLDLTDPGRLAPGGADAGAAAGPALEAALEALEAAPVPVVAALAGRLEGPALALALAAHYRVAAQGTGVGVPETALNRLPAPGVTQRLPRWTGAGPALALLLSGGPRPAAEVPGLVDAELPPDTDTLAGATAFADGLLAEGLGPRPALSRRFKRPEVHIEAASAARQSLPPDALPVAAELIACVEAAQLLPPEAGAAREIAAREDMAAHAFTAALAHVARARARRDAALPAVRPARIGVVGQGPMARALVLRGLADGARVDLSAAGVERAVAEIDAALEAEVAAGRLAQAERDARLGRFAAGEDLAALARAEAVIDVRPRAAELAERTRAVLAAPLAVLGGERLPEGAAALSTGLPGRLGPGVELSGPALPELAGALGRLGCAVIPLPPDVRSVVRPLWRAAWRTADRLLLAGLSPAEIDAACREAGLGEGPLRMADGLGLDALWDWRKRAPATGAEAAAGADGLIEALVAAGATGRGAGQGYFDAASEAPSHALVAALERLGSADAVPPEARADPATAILAAMAGAGAELVGRISPYRVDLAMVEAGGCPPRFGGPLHWADRRGLATVRNRLAALGRPVDPIWDDLIKNGRRFADL